MRSDFSNRVTEWPARASCWAQAMPAGPEPTTATRLPVFLAATQRLDPALLPAAIDDRAFDRFDGHRIVVDVERARGLAGRGADAAGEFGEVVGRVQHVERVLPAVAADQLVPVGDQVVDRTAVVAERDAAIHAARALLAHLGRRQRQDELLPRLEARLDLLVRPILALDLEEALDHDPWTIPPPRPWPSPRSRACTSARL